MSEQLDRQQRTLERAAHTIKGLRSRLDAVEKASREPIAVISMACRFPGHVTSPEELWELLVAGRDTRGEVPPDRWDKDNLEHDYRLPACKYGHFLDHLAQFDPHFFGITPKEAYTLDPQHRLLLEVSWEALERAGAVPDRVSGTRMGVFIGITSTDYGQTMERIGDANLLDAYFVTGNPLNAAAGRIAFTYGLRGPAVAFDTACSSSLVALHHAVQSIRSGECESALAGGVNIMLLPRISVSLAQASMLSPDGRCKSFAAEANGYARGEGCGLVYLKKLSQARADGDRVLAVIRSSIIGHDGASSGFTVPNGVAQEALIRESLKKAELSPDQIAFIEAHGTGTPLGDPIEAGALYKVFGKERETPLYVGSIKSNIGHLESAAGIAGFIKAVLAVHHRCLPPSLHAERRNEAIAWDESVDIATTLRPFSSPNTLRAGVSSFGASGTNAHVIIEEPPQHEVMALNIPKAPSTTVLALSAKTEAALQASKRQLFKWIEKHYPNGTTREERALLAWSQNTARPHYLYREAFLFTSHDDLSMLASENECTDVSTIRSSSAKRSRALFVLGEHTDGLSRSVSSLYESSETFKAALDRALEEGGLLYSTLFSKKNESNASYHHLFAYHYSFFEMWKSYGILPSAFCGSRVGGLACAASLGEITLKEAWRKSTQGLSLASELDFQSSVPLFLSTTDIHNLESFAETINRALSLQPSALISECVYPQESTVLKSRTADLDVLLPWSTHGHHSGDAWTSVCSALLQLFLSGATVEWRAFARPPGERLNLPTYPFEREHIWFTQKQSLTIRSDESVIVPLGVSNAMKPESPSIGSGLQKNELKVATVRSLLSRVTGMEEAKIDAQTPLFELGVDSLMLIEFQQNLEREHGISLALQAFTSDYDTVAKIAELLEDPEEEIVPLGANSLATPPISTPAVFSGGLEGIFSQQLELLKQHQQTLTKVIDEQIAALGGRTTQAVEPRTPATVLKAVPKPKAKKTEIKGLYGAKESQADSLTPQQRTHLEKLIARYREKTQNSWRYAETSREGAFAHNRNSFFRREFKDLTYLIAYDRAEGACFTDVDGNRYLDITMGFGVHLLGHNPPAVQAALAEEVSRGVAIGPVSRHGGEVAELISDLTGAERVAFFNTGSEAVMVAIRLARAVTGRDKIAVFSGSWHGSFDGVLASGYTNGSESVSNPMAPGTTESTVADVVVLRYGDPKALESLELLGPSLAAILVEPVQSRNPSLQPKEFVKEVSRISQNHGCALLFDEMITGFRITPGGAKDWYGVEPDIMTYGKIVGAGQPIGVVAGKRRFLDALDGGKWRFGDNSMPSVQPTLVAGTFNIHPLTMAAARAVLSEIKDSQGEIQNRVNALTKVLCDTLNDFYLDEGFPIRMNFYGSLFRFDVSGEYELLYYHLIDRGIFVWEGRNCFLSAAHTEKDVATIVSAVKDSLKEMREDGWIPEDPRKKSRPPLPLWRGQSELLAHLDGVSSESAAYHEGCLLELQGKLDVPVLKRALRSCCYRHDLLRARLAEQKSCWAVDQDVVLPLSEVDTSGLSAEEKAALVQKLLAEPFNLSENYGWRMAVLQDSPETVQLLLIAHHAVIDGWGLGVFAAELASLYEAYTQHQEPALPQPNSYASFVSWDEGRTASSDNREYWRNQLELGLAPWEACDRKLEGILGQSSQGGRVRRILSEEATTSLSEFVRKQGVSLYSTLLAASASVLRRVGNQDRFMVGCPVGLQAASGNTGLIGQATVIVPLEVFCSGEELFGTFAKSLHKKMLSAQGHEAGLKEAPGVPQYSVMVNVDQRVNFSFAGLETRVLELPPGGAKVPLFINAVTVGTELFLDIDYDCSRYTETQAGEWADALVKVLTTSSHFLERQSVESLSSLVPQPHNIDREHVTRAGHRIYLSEIETLIKETNHFAQACVFSENSSIIAGVQPNTPDLDIESSLGSLPSLLRPTHYVIFEQLPTDPSAEAAVRRAIRQNPRVCVQLLAATEEPLNDAERLVSRVVSETLHVTSPQMTASFFELGGRSLVALEVIQKLEEELKHPVSLPRLLRSYSLRDFAESLHNQRSFALPPIGRRPISGSAVPLLPAQENLWLLHEHLGAGQAYNLSKAYWITGDLDADLLCEAFSEVVVRHEALRTRIISSGDKLLQQYVPDSEGFVVSRSLLPGSSKGEVEEAARRLYEQEADYRFSLANDSLIRVNLAHAPFLGRYLLIVVIHHIISDGWSEGILARDVTEIYAAKREGREPHLVPLSVQYGDVATFYAENTQSEQKTAYLEIVRSQWREAPELLGLPTDKPRPAIQDFAGIRVEFALGPELSASVKAYAEKARCTPFAVLAAGYSALLSLYSGDEAVVLGTPVAQRLRQETRDVFGFLVTTGVLVCPTKESKSFSHLVSSIMERTSSLMEYQEVTFEQVVEALGPQRSASYNPVCQAFFAFSDFAHELPQLPDAELSELPGIPPSAGAKFDIALELEDKDGDYRGFCEFAASLFTDATILGMLEHLKNLLRNVLADPERKISKISLYAKEPLRMADHQRTVEPLSEEVGADLVSLFEEQVKRRGSLPALLYGAGESLSFAELDREANRVAHFLIDRGVGAGSVVAFSSSPSQHPIAVLLAILKCGATALSLDPLYPKARLTYMVEAASPGLIIAEEDGLFASANIPVVRLSELLSSTSSGRESSPSIDINKSGAAYLVFTSGSTGKPKGVASTHRAIVNRCQWMWQEFPFTEGEVCLQRTSYNFVDCLWETFGPLLQGIPLLIASASERQSPEELAELVERHRVTRLVVVPSLLEELMNQVDKTKLQSLTIVSCSGEALRTKLAHKTLKALPHLTLLNLYGQSEAGADCLWYKVGGTEKGEVVPLGEPIANTRVVLLDENLHSVPEGMEGEICVAGVAVANGYLNASEETQARFREHDFAPFGYLFRTGDRARVDENGVFHFLGRNDSQVKIRGFRVDTNEITCSINALEGIERCVVKVHQREGVGPQLVAYIEADRRSVRSDLRTLLKRELPHYMIPNLFVFLSAFPLTPNGKIDREALRPPAQNIPVEKIRLPESESETRVREIFSSLLGVEELSMDTDLFDAGGHSLLATRILSRIKDEFEIEISLTQLFENPTPLAVARLIAEQRTSSKLQEERVGGRL